MQEREIEVLEDSGGVQRVETKQLVLAGGGGIAFDECFWCTQAGAASWLSNTGLPTDKGEDAWGPCGACGWGGPDLA